MNDFCVINLYKMNYICFIPLEQKNCDQYNCVKLCNRLINYEIFFLAIDKIPYLINDRWRNFAIFWHEWVLHFFCQKWLTKFVIFFLPRINRQNLIKLTKSMIFCHDRLKKFVIFLPLLIDDIYNIFEAMECWNL